MYTKFSKPFNDILKIKSDFFSNNDLLLKNNDKLLKIYKTQPIRINCKNCGYKLGKRHNFINHKIKYKVCKKCSHINGNFEDTQKYNEFCYKPKNNNYIKFYEKSFNDRVKKIYSPKTQFLIDFFKTQKVKSIKVLDIGCGLGHFLKSLENKNIKAIGVETNPMMVKLGNSKLKKNKIFFSEDLDTLNMIKETDSNIISMISVLEHLNNPNEFLKCIKKSKAKFLYASIPMMSLSVLMENLFQNVFPRHLAATHTHIYTEKSIKYLLSKFKMKIVAEWWFGTDFLDMYRSMQLNLKKNKSELNLYLKNYILKNIDSFQKIIDKNKASSELHFIAKIKN